MSITPCKLFCQTVHSYSFSISLMAIPPIKTQLQTPGTLNNKLVWITTAESLMYTIKVLKVKISLTHSFSLHLYCRSSCSLAGGQFLLPLSLCLCLRGKRWQRSPFFPLYYKSLPKQTLLGALHFRSKQSHTLAHWHTQT